MVKQIEIELKTARKYIGAQRSDKNIKKIEIIIETIKFHLKRDTEKIKESKEGAIKTLKTVLKLRKEYNKAVKELQEITQSMRD